MKFKDYGRNVKKRKEHVQHPRKLTFTHSREGFQLFEKTIGKSIFRGKCRRVPIAMEPSGIYRYALEKTYWSGPHSFHTPPKLPCPRSQGRPLVY